MLQWMVNRVIPLVITVLCISVMYASCMVVDAIAVKMLNETTAKFQDYSMIMMTLFILPINIAIYFISRKNPILDTYKLEQSKSVYMWNILLIIICSIFTIGIIYKTITILEM